MDFKTQNKHQKNFVPSKKLGQNFLTDDNVAQEIVNLSQIQNYDLVIEVGPGRGALTQHLVTFNKPLIAIELDKRLAEDLKTKFHQYPHLQIINNDILEVDLLEISKDYKQVLLISNLPYSISTPMILKFLKQNKITSFVCMLQKEVVDRLIAKSHSKTYGAFSVLVQYYASIAKFLNVAPSAFAPIPAVESQVVLMSKNKLIFDNR
jgi:16S rRNA (adenine1518-N6/adenine1519-N6)-dimethyltransferase